MRSAKRTVLVCYGTLLRDVAALAGAVFVIGVSLGALATSTGMSRWLVLVMSATIFAGGAEFALVGVTAAGGAPIAAAVTCLVINARHLPYGWAVADDIADRLPVRLLGSHLMVDESVAYALAQPDRTQRRRAYWVSGATIYLGWLAGVFLGATVGTAIGDPATLGLDAAFPAALLALLAPHVRHQPGGRVAIAAAIVAVASAQFVPEGVPVLLAALAVVAALPLPRLGRGVT